MVKSKGVNLLQKANSRMDAAANRGPLEKAEVVYDGSDRKTVRMEFTVPGKPPAVQEVTLFRDCPYLRVDYIHAAVNIVDIEAAAGDDGKFEIHGAGQWKRGYLLYPEIFFDRHPGDVGYQNITEVDTAGPLEYKGWFILGVCNADSGIGYGRIMPVDRTDIIKLLKNGYEIFNHYRRPPSVVTGYIYAVTGGAEELLERGRKLAAENPAAGASVLSSGL